ncbi:MAG: cofactor assembly of complex C subunit B [Acaryochloridaceae cyanobacterium RL_2_7]|nr:cofactor assembly of complex C subunit B [Acaryochloridaceae cyanobacterium RL_2_7]
MVRPSLAVGHFYWSRSSATGIIAFSIVLSMSIPLVGLKFLGLVMISPIAGFFYWRGAERVEKVVVQVIEGTESTPNTTLKISAHRDELIVLEETLPYQVV